MSIFAKTVFECDKYRMLLFLAQDVIIIAECLGWVESSNLPSSAQSFRVLRYEEYKSNLNYCTLEQCMYTLSPDLV